MNKKQLSRGAKTALWGILCSLTLAVPTSACINHYDRSAPLPKPRPERPADFIAQLRNHAEHDRLVAAPAPADPGPNADFKARSDYAATLVHRGESRRAVEILESVEKSRPGEYQVAANLGTAYELAGDLVKAHHWISEGIRRNPKSHDGSEWVHLRILEARQALAQNPDWLRSHSVLGLDFGNDPQPLKPERWPKDSGDAEGVISALIYQLHERMAFVPAPNALVGGLIADLAVLLMLYRSVDVAVPVFELALTYRPVSADRVLARKAIAEEIVRSRGESGVLLKQGLIAFAALTLVGALFLRWRQGR